MYAQIKLRDGTLITINGARIHTGKHKVVRSTDSRSWYDEKHQNVMSCVDALQRALVAIINEPTE